MKRVSIIFLFLGVAVFASFAQTQKEKDIQAIKSMIGCYEVSFKFAETFNYVEDPDYKPSPVYQTGATEWVQLVEESDDKISLQHILVMAMEEDTFIIKHWRQDWEYENRDFYMYNGDNNWTYVKKPKKEVAGEWTQKVFQVDDSPRYEGTAPWIHVDGRSFWENTTPAPLPRREYTKRSDYNLTMRKNHVEITDKGWLHDQDNLKVVRKDGEEDVIIAEEKGYNPYIKIDAEGCQPAIDWWEENKEMWSTVRDNWDDVFAKRQSLALKPKVDNKRLYEHLFKMNPAEAQPKEIKEVITSFVER
jgi:hypothetical protein